MFDKMIAWVSGQNGLLPNPTSPQTRPADSIMRPSGQFFIDDISPDTDKVILFHGDCDDGFTSAFAAWKSLGKQAVYAPLQYGNWGIFDTSDNLLENLQGRDVWMIDFSVDRPMFMDITSVANSFTLIDHHMTADDQLHGLPGFHYDANHAGCVLAWKHFHPNKEIPLFLKLIEDSDLGRFILPETIPFIYSLRSAKRDFNLMDKMMLDAEVHKMVERGTAIASYMQHQIKEVLHSASKVEMAGANGLLINATRLVLAEVTLYLQQYQQLHGKFVALWHTDSAGRVTCSLRSDGSIDVASLAEQFGGGGNAYAAACRFPNIAAFQEAIKHVR